MTGRPWICRPIPARISTSTLAEDGGASHPIPADKSRYGRFDELREYNLSLLRSILEDAAKPGKHSAIEKKVGTFYAACMDEKTIDAKGIQPIQPWLKKIAGIEHRRQVPDVMAEMQAKGLRPAFSFGSEPDLHNSTINIAHLDQGGLTLADRDYYLKQDAKMVEVRGKYLQHIQNMLTLAGETNRAGGAGRQDNPRPRDQDRRSFHG